MYYSRREGILNAELWDEIDRTMSDFLAYQGIQEWWQTRRHWHTEAFARVVDGGAIGGYFGGMCTRRGACILFIGRKHCAEAVNSKGIVLDKSGGTERI